MVTRDAYLPSFLSALSGAIPTLLLALVLQKPLLLGLVRVAEMYREGVKSLESYRMRRWVLYVAPGGFGAIAKNVDYCIIAAGTVGMISSVGLQAVPAGDWTSHDFLSDLANFVFWFHLVVVGLLAAAVGGGLLVVTRGARASAASES